MLTALLLMLWPSLAAAQADVFVSVTASKDAIVEHEPVVLTYTVWCRHDMSWGNDDYPRGLDDWNVVELNDGIGRRTESDRWVDGIRYEGTVWRKLLLFPLRTGRLTVPGAKLDVTMMVDVSDPFDAMLTGITETEEVKSKVSVPPKVINVKPLENQPENYSGGVGTFSIENTTDGDTLRVEAGIPFTMRYRISGTGNLDLLSLPVPVLSGDFDVQEPHPIRDSITTGTRGQQGWREYEVTAMARRKGEHNISGPQLVFFDSRSRQYATAEAKPTHIIVEAGEPVAHHDSLRPQHNTAAAHRIFLAPHFFGTRAHWASVLSILLAALCIYTAARLWRRVRSAASWHRRQTSGRTAQSLEAAAKTLASGSTADFHQELLRTLWAFAGDTLHIPKAGLSRRSVETAFESRGVPHKEAARFTSLIDRCEAELYAPTHPSAGEEAQLLGDIRSVIAKIEDSIQQQQ